MPFRSEAQRRFMFAKHPEIAERWAHEGQSVVKNAKKGANVVSPGKSGKPTFTKVIKGGKGGGGQYSAKPITKPTTKPVRGPVKRGKK